MLGRWFLEARWWFLEALSGLLLDELLFRFLALPFRQQGLSPFVLALFCQPGFPAQAQKNFAFGRCAQAPVDISQPFVRAPLLQALSGNFLIVGGDALDTFQGGRVGGFQFEHALVGA